MAKEKFERTKPHVNVGTVNNTQTLLDETGQLTADDFEDAVGGNPSPSVLIEIDAPASSVPQSATVAYPIDTDFAFDPATNGAAVSLDFQLEVLPSSIVGTPDIDVSLAIIQGEAFVATRVGSPLPSVDGSEAEWTQLGMTGLRAEDFIAVDGDGDRPDFGRPFQFGYAFLGEYSTTALSVELGLDNMEVEITTVPEPNSIMLAATMGAAVLWNRWRSDE